MFLEVCKSFKDEGFLVSLYSSSLLLLSSGLISIERLFCAAAQHLRLLLPPEPLL